MLPQESVSKNIFFKSDMDFNYTKVRPFGGQAWLINKKFKIYETKFINKHISFTHVNAYNNELLLIGIHLPFENSADKAGSKVEFLSSLSLVSSLLNKYSHSGIPSFIIGDFNADPWRSKAFDRVLADFINQESLLTLDFLNIQKIDYTYLSYKNLNNGTNIYKANLISQIKT